MGELNIPHRVVNILWPSDMVLYYVSHTVFIISRLHTLPVGPEGVRFYYGTVGTLMTTVHPSLTFKFMVGLATLSPASICYVMRII